MRKLIIIMIMIMIISIPGYALAAFQMDFRVEQKINGVFCGEIWYDNKVIWRVNLVPDGAQPVTGSAMAKGISLFPDVQNGFMLLKVSFN